MYNVFLVAAIRLLHLVCRCPRCRLPEMPFGTPAACRPVACCPASASGSAPGASCCLCRQVYTCCALAHRTPRFHVQGQAAAQQDRTSFVKSLKSMVSSPSVSNDDMTDSTMASTTHLRQSFLHFTCFGTDSSLSHALQFWLQPTLERWTSRHHC